MSFDSVVMSFDSVVPISWGWTMTQLMFLKHC